MLKTGEPQLRVDKHDPDVISHILMVLSTEQLAKMLCFSGVEDNSADKGVVPTQRAQDFLSNLCIDENDLA